MKIKKVKPVIDNIEFDSLDEVLFYRWLKEAKEAGFINYFKKCDTTLLSDRVLKINAKGKDVMLQKEIVYTPDFQIGCMKDSGLIHLEFPKGYNIIGSDIYFDVKGACQLSIRSKSANTFPIKRAWLYQKTGIWVHKLDVFEWFKKTWCPSCPEVFSQNPKLCYSKFDGMKLNNGTVLKSKETSMLETILFNVIAELNPRFSTLKQNIWDVFVNYSGNTVVEYCQRNFKNEIIADETGRSILSQIIVKETPQQVQAMMYDVVKFNEKRRK